MNKKTRVSRSPEFVSVYRVNGHRKILYHLLKERPRFMNISHQRMPSFADHERFVRSRPYKEWYLIRLERDIIGSLYLTHLNEIGIFLFKNFHGKTLEKEVLKKFISGRRALRLLANVSLKNSFYQKLFRALGFRPIQKTYCLEPAEKRRSR